MTKVRFDHGPRIEFRPDGEGVLLEKFEITVFDGKRRTDYSVPRAFGSDGDSRPRLTSSFFDKWGGAAFGAIPHDWDYWIQDKPRRIADRNYRIINREIYGFLTSWGKWSGLRVGGWVAWRNNAKKKAKYGFESRFHDDFIAAYTIGDHPPCSLN